MLLPLAAAIFISATLQSPTQAAVADRARAEELARAGRNAEALQLFTGIVKANPADVEARVWIGRLDLRLGRVEEAEAAFRLVLRDHPDNVEARIGLATILTRAG